MEALETLKCSVSNAFSVARRKCGVEWAMALMVVFTVAGIILYTELKDRKDDRRQRQQMSEGIRVAGKIIGIDEKTDKFGRSLHIWCVKVQFEYEGIKYVVDRKTNETPTRSVGSAITVFVDRNAPWKSTIIL
jgi:hypothetical protein